MDVGKLQTEYDSRKKHFQQLVDKALFSIKNELDRKNIKIHSIPYRIKPFDSFRDKIRRKEITDPFNDILDIVGLRVICLFLDDLQIIITLLKNIFVLIEEENIPIGDSDVKIFGYMLPQLKVKLKDESNTDPDYEHIKNIIFEIQVRTIAQDAWASISHHLDYKKENKVPDNLRRDFYALNGLFYVADTHFEMLRRNLITEK